MRAARTRILYVQPAYFDPASYIGGGERYPQNLARAVAAAADGDTEITIVSFGSEAKRVAIAERVRFPRNLPRPRRQSTPPSRSERRRRSSLLRFPPSRPSGTPATFRAG
jgi:hypothetical protein